MHANRLTESMILECLFFKKGFEKSHNFKFKQFFIVFPNKKMSNKNVEHETSVVEDNANILAGRHCAHQWTEFTSNNSLDNGF